MIEPILYVGPRASSSILLVHARPVRLIGQLVLPFAHAGTMRLSGGTAVKPEAQMLKACAFVGIDQRAQMILEPGVRALLGS